MVLTTDSTIGVVGLGNLGRPLALNLIDKGWRLAANDSRLDRVNELKATGTVIGSDMDSADVLCFVVPDERAIWAVLNTGLLEAMNGRAIVVHSTILPERARELADAVETAGGRFAAAPVSGGPERARIGDLSLIAGADAATSAFLAPLFDAMSREVFSVASPAAACAVKLANQLVMFSALASLHEAMSLTQSYGVDDTDLLQFVESATGDTWVGRHWGFFDDVAHDYDRAGTPEQLRPWSKDLWEVLGAAREAQVSAPVAGILSQTLPAIVDAHARRVERGLSNAGEGGHA
ncbi:NAD(P)-dependent oxidoreductase [Paramicrobacterium fandaimingii]|uniref:NAD(P)-dependent oxidoreductase n=1 Tax=Paramicrobacterium fandaimingii TaxID=2708079 RepID=UPI00141E9776|nr:NAD(P)-binding domain-containing protein [Microbacterium fandaimingii]